MNEVKDQGHTLYPVTSRCTSFSFHINRTNHYWDMTKIVFDFEKTHPKYLKKICQNNKVTKPNLGNNHNKGNRATTFCSHRMSGSYFSVQTSKFLLIDATAVTLGQGHGNVIQYILPNLFIFLPKYLRLSSNSFDVRGKSCCGGGRGGGRGNELKT